MGDRGQHAVNEGQGDATCTPLMSEVPGGEPDIQAKMRSMDALAELPNDGLLAFGPGPVEQLGDDWIDDGHRPAFE